MYINKRLRAMILSSVMCGGLMLMPTICPAGIVNGLPLPMVSVAQAKVATYTGVGKYITSDFENQQIARQRAIDRAIRNAKDKAGVYLQTYSHSINANLSNDEISAITSNASEVLETECLPVPFEQDGEAGLMYRATVKVNVDDAEVRAWLNRDAQNRTTIVNQNNTVQQAAEANDRQVEDLRKRAQAANTDEERANIKAAYEQVDNEFLLNQKLEEGNQSAYQGDYNGAIAKYTEIIQINPNYTAAYNNRGNVYHEMQNYSAAISDYTKAIELKPNYALAYYNRGLIYQNMQNYNAAIADYTKAIQINPKDADSYYNRGLAYNYKQNYNAAIVDCTKAIELNPQYADAYTCRGVAYDDMGNYNAAIADYTKAIKINPNNSLAYNNRGNAYKNMSNYNAAINDYTKAIQLNPQYATAYYNRGNAYYQLKNYNQAITNYNKAIELNPQHANAYYNRGLIYKNSKQYNEAISDFSNYIRLVPNDKDGYEQRGYCYQQLGDNARAQADFAKAKQLGYNG